MRRGHHRHQCHGAADCEEGYDCDRRVEYDEDGPIACRDDLARGGPYLCDDCEMSRCPDCGTWDHVGRECPEHEDPALRGAALEDEAAIDRELDSLRTAGLPSAEPQSGKEET